MSNPRIDKKVVLAKLESTYGTDPSPVVASDPVRAFNVGDYMTEFNSLFPKTHDRSTYLKAIPGTTYAMLTFRVWLSRTSTNGVEHMLSRLLKACFWKHSSATLNKFDTIGDPDATNDSVTIYFYNDGLLEKLTGARGTAQMHIESGGDCYLEFKMTGKYQTVGASACPTVDEANYSEGEIFTAQNNTLTIGGQDYHTFILEFSDGNIVAPLPSCTDEYGVYMIGISKSDPRGTVHVLVDTTSAATVQALIENSTETTISFSNSDYSNLKVEFKTSLFTRPAADVEGYLAWNMDFVITGGIDIDFSKPA